MDTIRIARVDATGGFAVIEETSFADMFTIHYLVGDFDGPIEAAEEYIRDVRQADPEEDVDVIGAHPATGAMTGLTITHTVNIHWN